jgi:hypothetical protein
VLEDEKEKSEDSERSVEINKEEKTWRLKCVKVKLTRFSATAVDVGGPAAARR